jgi:ferredoxin
MLRLKAAILARYPGVRFHTWTPVSDDNAREGAKIAFGDRARPIVDFSRPRVIVSIDCDFLATEPGAVRSARLFAQGRRITSPSDPMSRLYMVESTLSLTGSNADHRLRMRSGDVEGYLRALGRTLVSQGAALGGIGGALSDSGEASEIPTAWLEAVARDLLANRGRSVIVVGSRQPARVHALAHAINESLGANDTIIQFSSAPDESENPIVSDITALVTDMRAGSVSSLLILGGNPALDAPADLDFTSALESVEFTAHLGSHEDETSAACGWHLPLAHELESWSDHRSIDGTLALQQPLIAPLRNGRNATDLLGLIAVGAGGSWRSYHQVRQTFVLVVTQQHHSMDTDPSSPGTAPSTCPSVPLAIVATHGRVHASGWGMVIDLTTCTGCNACVVACQAENNIPVVGKEQVMPAAARCTGSASTATSSVTTREPRRQRSSRSPACSAKRRPARTCARSTPRSTAPKASTRWRTTAASARGTARTTAPTRCGASTTSRTTATWHPTELERMQFNPNVTVRMRGVMEKCTYCVQRIQAAEDRARNDGNRREMKRRRRGQRVRPGVPVAGHRVRRPQRPEEPRRRRSTRRTATTPPRRDRHAARAPGTSERSGTRTRNGEL